MLLSPSQVAMYSLLKTYEEEKEDVGIMILSPSQVGSCIPLCYLQ